MNPVIAQNGASFRGAGLYYLHDKAADAATPKHKKPKTAERVEWAETRNLAHDDITGAIDEMWATAARGPELKRLAGKTGGRPMTKPVKTLALTWHPDETPDREAMRAAADDFLASMGWQEHQAVLIRHTDTKHPHLHIIINRVHPDTGLALDDGNEQRRAQKWALGYEQAHGRIWCRERERKHAGQEREGKSSGLPYEAVLTARAAEATFLAAETRLASHDRKHERDQLSERQKAERDEFFALNKAYVKAIRNEVYAQVKEEWRATWTEHYAFAKNARAEARQFAATEQLAARSHTREHNFVGARLNLEARDSYLALAEDTIRIDRASLKAQQRADTRERQNEAAAAFINERHAAYDALRARQQDQRHELKALQSARAAGKPYDAARLEALLAPHTPRRDPDPLTTARIAKILDRMADRHKGPRIMADDRDSILDELARRKADADHQAEMRNVTQLVRDNLSQYTDTLKGLDAGIAAEAEAQKQARDRLAAFAREQEEAAKRQREAEQLAEQQKSDDRNARQIGELTYVRDAGERTAQALGRYYDVTRPYQSLAGAAMHEHELWQKERDQLRHQIAHEQDPARRELLQIRERIEAYDYAASLAQRNGRLSEVITGRDAHPARTVPTDPDKAKTTDDRERHDAHYEAQRAAVTGEIGNAQARQDYALSDQCADFARNLRTTLAVKAAELAHRAIEQGRAGAAVSEAQRAHSMGTEADRTETDRTQAGRSVDAAFLASMERRREMANFRSASARATTMREPGAHGSEARDDAGDKRDKPRERERGRGEGLL